MVSMEWDPDYVPGVKLGLHSFQIILSFTVWCLEIATFVAKDAKIVGNNAWTFSVCFLSIPAWIYLIMTPRFSRARKFAEPHAMLVVDLLFTIIWLSAFATQAAYNTSGLCGKGCSLSKAIVALGVFITLFFAGSTVVSAYTLQYYKFHGTLPGYDTRKIRGGDNNNIDPDKAAFSMAPHDEEAYERVNMDDHDHDHDHDDRPYGHSNPYSTTADDDDPNRYGALPPRQDPFNADTEYSSGGAGVPPLSMPYGGAGSASHVSYSDEPAKFPAGNYDRVHP
ncbi:chaperone-binding protein [Purpureocillium lilacinum]|uniref:Chaperone-binding protein n=2 Tax=Purpureocillium lilacinum TaxID=33203 RepID=A0A179GIP8_PURLI|nr:chaperone-binding protein [Purpureocillium lilacinum]